MTSYIMRRIVFAIIIVFAVSVVAFFLIQLPPGSFIDSLVMRLKLAGTEIGQAQIVALEKRYGLDLPVYLQYFKWMGNIFQGDFGRSLQWNRPVIGLLMERIPLTAMISYITLIFVYLVAIPIAIYSATHQYSILDYVFTGVGFGGLSIPNFLLALVMMVLFLKYFNMNVASLFSQEYMGAIWSWGKFVNMLQHLWVPIIIIGTAGTAGTIRVLRSCLLDELSKQYVITARAKGLSERKILFKYPVRMAINPLVSTIGWSLTGIISGETLTAMVLNLPTAGPLLLGALLTQDTYLAGSIVLILSILVVAGTLISDVLLVLIDPRIRYEK